MDYSDGFAACLISRTKTESQSCMSGIYRQVNGGTLVTDLQRMVRYDGVLRPSQRLNACSKSTLPREKVKARFWLPKFGKRHTAPTMARSSPRIGTVILHLRVTYPGLACQAPLRIVTPSQWISLRLELDHPAAPRDLSGRRVA